MKIFKKAIDYDGYRCDVHHVEADNFDDLPDGLQWKAHGVCFWNGKMLLVNHSKWNIWSLPGGTREPGEFIEETLKREILEESNCEVVDYRPIAYQKVISPTGNAYYRLYYLCRVKPIGEFKEDVAGHVGKIAWIQPNDFEKYVEKKEFRRIVIRRALALFEKTS